MPQGTVQSVLKKYGIEVVDGKVKSTAEAKPLTTADKTALEDFINVYGNEPQLSSNAFLNARSGLSQLSKYDAAKTGNLNVIARDLRGVYDDLGKGQIKGLSELDAQYAPEVKALNQIKKDYLTATGEFKDGAINKIANLTGAGKDQILNRLEQIVPGVTQRIKLVKAAEDIEKASGLKVGTYARAGLGVFGVSTFNIPAILTAIIASPEVAVRLLKAYGYTKKTAEPITRALYGMANDVNNFRLPGGMQNYISEYIKNPKAGMSIEDITRSQPELIPKGKNIKEIQKPLSSPKSTTKAPVKSIVEEAKNIDLLKKNQIYKNFTQDIIGNSKVGRDNLLNTPDSSRYAWRAANDASLLLENSDLPNNGFKIITGKTKEDVINSLNKNINLFKSEKDLVPPTNIKKITEVLEYIDSIKLTLGLN